MIKHKLIEILSTFDKNEFADFEKFTNSPFFNEGRNYLPVVKALKAFFPTFNDVKFTKEILFNQIYAGEKFNENKLNIAFSRLYNMSEDFLAAKRLKEDNFGKNKYILEAFLEKKLYRAFEKKMAAANNSINNESGFSEKYFEEKSILHRIDADKIFSNDELYQRKEDLLKRTEYTLYSMINRMILCRYDLTIFENEFGKSFDTGIVNEYFKVVDIEQILKCLKDSGSEYYAAMAMKYYGILLRMPCSNEIYSDFKELFYSNVDSLGNDEKFVYYNNMSAYCIRKSNEGDKDFDLELLNIYKEMLERNVISHNSADFIELQHYRNMLLTALDANDISFIEMLLDKYSDKLNPEHKNDMINFTRAKMHFARSEFEQSLNFASKVNHEFFLFKIDIRTLLLQLYFQLGYYEELFSLIDSFRHFISASSDISESRKTRFLNFLRFTNSIAKAVIEKDDLKLQKINEELDSGGDVALVPWLQSRIKITS